MRGFTCPELDSNADAPTGTASRASQPAHPCERGDLNTFDNKKASHFHERLYVPHSGIIPNLDREQLLALSSVFKLVS